MTFEQQCVEAFHKEFGIPISHTPNIPNDKERRLRVELIQEELDELQVAFTENNIVEVADGLGDLLYVVLGCAVTCGIDLEPIFKEVHRSNMTKVGGHLAENGKWIKPSTYEPPQLLPILQRCKTKLNTHGWSQKQLDCPHKEVEFSNDLSCGGWFETCKQCRAIIDCGMVGHN